MAEGSSSVGPDVRLLIINRAEIKHGAAGQGDAAAWPGLTVLCPGVAWPDVRPPSPTLRLRGRAR
eukprot:7874834-Alexandrium_andersonii.AAC.1